MGVIKGPLTKAPCNLAAITALQAELTQCREQLVRKDIEMGVGDLLELEEAVELFRGGTFIEYATDPDARARLYSHLKTDLVVGIIKRYDT